MNLGKIQKLKVKEMSPHGAILTDGTDTVLLPNNESADLKIGKEVDAFLYKDSKDRLIATLKTPYLTVGKIGMLEVVAKSRVGYFVNIGLDKDVFLPFKEVNGRIFVEERYLFYMYEDRGRLCVTMNLRDHLKRNDKFKVNDRVEGTIYAIDRKYGAFVAICNEYDGFLPIEELKGAHTVGEQIEARVLRILKDKKITLTFRDYAYKQRKDDAEEILALIKENNGKLNLGDKSDSEEIKRVTGLSKKAFKRAAGTLYKMEMIDIKDNSLELREW